MNRLATLTISILVLALLFGSFPVSAQNSEPAQFFPQTGHWVQGSFLTTWKSENKGFLLYGFPITEQFESDGHIIQYFQRGRMELHAELPDQIQVQMYPLGYELWKMEQSRFIPRDDNIPNNPACTLIDGSSSPICYSFKDFYEDNNGTSRFGKPISGVGYLDEVLVQYFENARFEWHPELPNGQQVTLGKIGLQYFNARENSRLALPHLSPPINNAPISPEPQLTEKIVLSAFPNWATLQSSGKQNVYVVVQDQNFIGLENVIVKLSIKLPSGRMIEDDVLTNKNGFGMLEFSFSGESVGTANIKATVMLDSLQTKKATSMFTIR